MSNVLWSLLLLPVIAYSGVVYEVAIRPVDANMQLTAVAEPPVVTQCYVDDGNVRVGGTHAKMVYLFKNGIMYAIDNPARTVHVLKHATLSQLTAHYAAAVKQLEDAAAGAPPGERATAEQKATDMKAASERLQQPVARDYRVTARFESVDGRACRIWEERESGAKRLELCVAPTSTVPGGAEILNGMKTLSQFRQGSDFAVGVDFGLSDWWPDIERLGGLPLLIREYKYDSEVSEVLLTGMRAQVSAVSQFDVPAGYRLEDGPDYTQWYVR
jgi:hypothetical protein